MNIFVLNNRQRLSAKWVCCQFLFILWLTYSKLSKRDFSETRKEFESQAKDEINGNVLDIGGGSGWMSEYWQPINQKDNYFLIDPLLRKEVFNTAAYKKNRLKVIRSTAESIPLSSKSFDLIIIAATIDHVDDPDRVLSEAKRLLKSKGRLLVIQKVVKNLKYSISHINCYSLETLTELLKKEFKINQTRLSEDGKIAYVWAETGA